MDLCGDENLKIVETDVIKLCPRLMSWQRDNCRNVLILSLYYALTASRESLLYQEAASFFTLVPQHEVQQLSRAVIMFHQSAVSLVLQQGSVAEDTVCPGLVASARTHPLLGRLINREQPSPVPEHINTVILHPDEVWRISVWTQSSHIPLCPSQIRLHPPVWPTRYTLDRSIIQNI